MTDTAETLLARVRQHAKEQLLPLAPKIDQDGVYPEEWLHALGALGGFTALGHAPGSGGLSLATQIEITDVVAQTCGATAFTLWSQGSCAWYLRQSTHDAVRARYLPSVLGGTLLAGSGFSNTAKHLAGIERELLQARRTPAGDYRVSGILPWVSNIGAGHIFATAAALEGGGYVAFILPCDAPGLTLKPCPPFAGMEGTRTLNVRCADVLVPATDVLAQAEEFDAFIERIQPGFILLQVGMAAGIIAACIRLSRRANQTHTVTNAWLDDQPDTLQHALDALRARARTLAEHAEAGNADLLAVLRVRLQASELALRAAQSSALHAGARGYLLRHGAQRRSREAMFVAILTPALKQLRRDINRLQQARVETLAVRAELAHAA